MGRYVFYDWMLWNRYEISYRVIADGITYPSVLACNESVWIVPNLVHPYG
jgi:hypothetical protein